MGVESGRASLGSLHELPFGRSEPSDRWSEVVLQSPRGYCKDCGDRRAVLDACDVLDPDVMLAVAFEGKKKGRGIELRYGLSAMADILRRGFTACVFEHIERIKYAVHCSAGR